MCGQALGQSQLLNIKVRRLGLGPGNRMKGFLIQFRAQASYPVRQPNNPVTGFERHQRFIAKLGRNRNANWSEATRRASPRNSRQQCSRVAACLETRHRTQLEPEQVRGKKGLKLGNHCHSQHTRFRGRSRVFPQKSRLREPRQLVSSKQMPPQVWDSKRRLCRIDGTREISAPPKGNGVDSPGEDEKSGIHSSI